MTFLFDTGASMVVLAASRRKTRRRRQPAGLTFDVPVTTANGAALAAEVQLNEIAVGPIVMRNVGEALVARQSPGALEESLLGMSFLERLKSYTVERENGSIPVTGEVTGPYAAAHLARIRELRSTRATAARNTSRPASARTLRARSQEP